jgi:O-antigen/teichoic acid export membrane protein
LRGSRYVLAATLPVTIVIICLAQPILDVWLGKRYGGAATAVAIFTATFVLADASVIGSMLMGVSRLRELTVYTWAVALVNLAISLALTPIIGVDGVVAGTTGAYVLLYPLLLRFICAEIPVTFRDLAREVWLPGYSLGVLLAAGLVAVRLTLSPHTLVSVVFTGCCSMLLYWLAFYVLWMRPDERALVRSVLRLGSRPRPLALTDSP